MTIFAQSSTLGCKNWMPIGTLISFDTTTCLLLDGAFSSMYERVGYSGVVWVTYSTHTLVMPSGGILTRRFTEDSEQVCA